MIKLYLDLERRHSRWKELQEQGVLSGWTMACSDHQSAMAVVIWGVVDGERLEKEHWKNVRSLCQKVLNLRLTVIGEFKCTEVFSQASLSSQRTWSSTGSNIFPQETCFFESQAFESHMK